MKQVVDELTSLVGGSAARAHLATSSAQRKAKTFGHSDNVLHQIAQERPKKVASAVKAEKAIPLDDHADSLSEFNA
jgi:hypothetical protein